MEIFVQFNVIVDLNKESMNNEGENRSLTSCTRASEHIHAFLITTL